MSLQTEISWKPLEKIIIACIELLQSSISYIQIDKIIFFLSFYYFNICYF